MKGRKERKGTIIYYRKEEEAPVWGLRRKDEKAISYNNFICNIIM